MGIGIDCLSGPGYDPLFPFRGNGKPEKTGGTGRTRFPAL